MNCATGFVVGVVKTPRMSTCIYQMQVLESVMVFRLAAGGVAEVVVPLGLAKTRRLKNI
jgi:hypothetical protein